MVKGESGLLAISRADFMPVFQPSVRLLSWPKGVIATTFSADEPERLHGPQHDHAWVDEPGAWRYGQEAWDMLMFVLRLGDHPQVCATSTPRPTKLIKALVADPQTIISKSTTYDNRLHLAPSFFSDIIAKYEGTRLGEQDLMAELLEITEGGVVPGVRNPEARLRNRGVRQPLPDQDCDRRGDIPVHRRGLLSVTASSDRLAADHRVRRLPGY